MSDRQQQKTRREVVAPSRRISCPQCESGYLVRQPCSAVCENCGYVESCEDNFVPNQDNPTEQTDRGGLRAANKE